MKTLRATLSDIMTMIGFSNSATITDTRMPATTAPFLADEEWIAAIEFPLDVVKGRIADFKALRPGAPVVKLPNADDLCREEASKTPAGLIQQFMQTTS